MNSNNTPQDGCELDPKQEIKRLSALPFIDYQLCRNKEAKKLGIPVSALDKLRDMEPEKEQCIKQLAYETDGIFPEVELWPKTVIGSELFDEISSTIRRYTVLPEEDIVAVSLWVIFTWLHHYATVSPILNVSSPEKRCGKSTLLSVLILLCCKPMVASNISPAAVYRAIQEWEPTLVIDEADTFFGNSSDLQGITNAGHYKRTAFVMRCDGEDHKPTRFSTWCPKVIAGIGQLSGTVMDRSVIIEMRRKLPGQSVESIRRADESQFEEICSKLARWSQDNGVAFKNHRPQEVEGINDRAQDNWEPLLAIAELIGDECSEQARNAAIKISGSDEDTPSIGEQLLMDIVEVFGYQHDDKISTAGLIDALCCNEEKPWATWNRGSRITPFQLSQKLRPFDIKPRNIRFSSGIRKGYYGADFADALSRYAPQSSATGVTDATNSSDIPDLGGLDSL